VHPGIHVGVLLIPCIATELTADRRSYGEIWGLNEMASTGIREQLVGEGIVQAVRLHHGHPEEDTGGPEAIIFACNQEERAIDLLDRNHSIMRYDGAVSPGYRLAVPRPCRYSETPHRGRDNSAPGVADRSFEPSIVGGQKKGKLTTTGSPHDSHSIAVNCRIN